jgi:arylsulfatase A-like enzyme
MKVRYDASIAFVDHEIGKLIKSLYEWNLFDKTLVLITGDHGESLGEHGIFFDHHGLYDVSIRVPLIIEYSKLPKNKRVKGLVQHSDIAPTILDIIGVDIDRMNFNGKTLLPLINGKKEHLHSAIYAEEADTERKIAIRTEDYKYIVGKSENEATCRYCGYLHGGMQELYDLNKDPKELQNIVDEKVDTSEDLRKQLRGWIRSLPFKTSQDWDCL